MKVLLISDQGAIFMLFFVCFLGGWGGGGGLAGWLHKFDKMNHEVDLITS